MNLRIKFNLVIMICCAISFLIVYLNINNNINANMQVEIENKAELILSISHKTDQISEEKSLFKTRQILENFNPFDYKYSIAFTNAKSSEYQANIWQKQVIDSLIQQAGDSKFSGIKSDENGEFYILADAIKSLDNQIIGAKIVTIHKNTHIERVEQELNQHLLVLIIIFIVLLIIINLLIQILIIKPIKLISQEANQISRGQTSIEELQVQGKDEISELSHSFNRIIRSLKAAMKLLNN